MILLELFKAIKEKGGTPFIVGGFVRDKILGFPNKDYDVEVFNIIEYDFENILKKFGTFKKVGNFSIYLIKRNIEIYLNIEKKDLSLDEQIYYASRRRDFTMNALYYDLLENKIVDYLDGQKDIEKKILKYSEKVEFLRDPLRILRAVYFSSKYDFEISNELMNIIFLNKEKLKMVSKERIFNEIQKVFNNKKIVSKYFENLKKLGLDNILFDENVEFSKMYLLKSNDINDYFAVLALETKNFPYFFVEDKTIIRNSISISNSVKLLEKANEITDYLINKLSRKTNLKSVLRIYGLGDNDKKEKLVALYKEYLKRRNALEPLVEGKDLIEMGYKPSKFFSEVLEELYDLQLQNKFKNKLEALEYLKRKNDLL
ncbi:MAG: CCA tRNA nucleotidyltransferase [Fusobacteriaceae bacterium]|nr:CCA tRNA nucleotidyltransferase [Fusobacteriaceae bacterium]MBN2838377.1 CCA tRNA nucleotidyltransferase [Fusobacteriaceae bacterium]